MAEVTGKSTEEFVTNGTSNQTVSMSISNTLLILRCNYKYASFIIF